MDDTRSKYRDPFNIPAGIRSPVSAFIAGWDRAAAGRTPDVVTGWGSPKSAFRSNYHTGHAAYNHALRQRFHGAPMSVIPNFDSELDKVLPRYFGALNPRKPMPVEPDNCCKCGAASPTMHNRDASGNRLRGYICVDCWKAIHMPSGSEASLGDPWYRHPVFMWAIYILLALAI